MSLLDIVFELAVIVLAMLATATFVLVGPRRLVAAIRGYRWRLEACLLSIAALAIVLALRVSTRDIVLRLERRVIGYNITYSLFDLEQQLFGETPVALLQSVQSEALTTFFVFIYIYGYAFLLLFPIVAYFALEEMDELSTLLLAYTANYGIGLLCYTLFIAYGPRNLNPMLFEGLLYDAFPQSYTLTGRVNQNTNVFPSLHTSLSMTVFFLAWVTRDRYPLWVPIAGFLAISVALSTMYLGIHWFLDVVAGTLLALLSVYIGVNYTVEGLVSTGRQYLGQRFDGLGKPGGE